MKREQDIDVNDELIVRYLAGEALPEEAMALHDWCEDAENAAYFEQLATTWNVMHSASGKMIVNRADAWKKMNAAFPQSHPKVRNFIPVSTAFRVAASLLLVAVAAGLFYVKLRTPGTTLAETTEQQKDIVLSDHSRIVLYHHTAITYPPKFNNDSREVSMQHGEAFFAITPDKQRPFVIHTKRGDIKVLGTEFNVVASDDAVEVYVKSGLVYLATGGDGVYLKGGTTGRISAGQQTIVTTADADVNVWAYATRRLEFRETSLDEVIHAVEKTLGCSIRVSNENIRHCKLTATFDNDSADKIVHLIAETLSLTYRKNGVVFTLEGEGCP